MEPEMAEQPTDNPDRIDYATSTMICRAIGERLVGTQSSDAADLPPRFQSLLAALQHREDRDTASESIPPAATV